MNDDATHVSFFLRLDETQQHGMDVYYAMCEHFEPFEPISMLVAKSHCAPRHVSALFESETYRYRCSGGFWIVVSCTELRFAVEHTIFRLEDWSPKPLHGL